MKTHINYFLIAMLSLLIIACEQKKENPLDVQLNAPFVSNIAVTPDVIDTDSILVGGTPSPNDLITLTFVVSGKATHPDGNGTLKTVQCEILSPTSTSTLATVRLFNNGVFPDTSTTDNIFTGTVSIQIKRVQVGNFSVRLSASDKAGMTSNTIIHRLRVVRSSNAPVISNLVAPDTVTLPPSPYSVLFVMHVNVTDADGKADIEKVYFRNLDSPSDTNKQFLLFDDGIKNDVKYDSVSADGVYSGRFQLPWNTPPQSYRFEFVAVDQLGVMSNKILHTMIVRQP
ncbi:MAG: hypothetical protein HY960_00260 [Ignavibacteriae bacterium]|nr:hypothetical protein [Ignavibacteriota bacterium]